MNGPTRPGVSTVSGIASSASVAASAAVAPGRRARGISAAPSGGTVLASSTVSASAAVSASGGQREAFGGVDLVRESERPVPANSLKSGNLVSGVNECGFYVLTLLTGVTLGAGNPVGSIAAGGRGSTGDTTPVMSVFPVLTSGADSLRAHSLRPTL